MAQQLGRLQSVPLREAWPQEWADFTPWLALEDNLRQLGETIGLDLELESQEREVGPFRADILCKDTADDSWVLIENQLERTDHIHLGQLLTYAAGLNAVTIVWIAERFTEEHRAALDWLNEKTDATINLFGLEIELWRIGDSLIAPKFNIISQPNEWSRTIKQAASVEVSDHKQLQLRFWTAFRDYMQTASKNIRCQKPLPQHWMNHAVGRKGAHLASIVSLWNSKTGLKGPEIRAELILEGPTAKTEFAALLAKKEQIESDLGFQLTWHNPEKKNNCRLYVQQDADFLNEGLWKDQYDWLRRHLEIMHRVLGPILTQLKATLQASERATELS